MLGWKEDFIYVVFLFWGPGMLLIATLPGILRVVVGFLLGAGWVYLWHILNPAGPWGYALALAPILLGIFGSRTPRVVNPDPPASKLLMIPFLVMFTAIAWMALGPIWRERMAIRQFALESVQVDGQLIQDLPAFQRVLGEGLSCGDVNTQLGAPLPLTLTVGGKQLKYRLVYHREQPGLIILHESADHQLLYSAEMLELVEQTGVKVPR